MVERIKVTLTEDVRVYYESELTRESWEALKLSYEDTPIIYKDIKDMSFDTLVAVMRKEAPDILWEIPTGYGDVYYDRLSSIVESYLNDEAYNNGSYDEKPYDDSVDYYYDYEEE